MLSFSIKRFSCSKEGNSSIENEDAFIVPPPEVRDSNIRVAVADGATESSFSKEWAEMLVFYFYAFDFNNSSFNSNIHGYIRRSWLNRINSNDLPWYAQEKLELGAFASFVGADINLENGNSEIIAVGDSNCFLFRQNNLELTFPIEKSEDFGNTPFLISSEANKNETAASLFAIKSILLLSGDILILATDAISQWLLNEIESGNNPIIKIKEMLYEQNDNQAAFQTWLTEERNNHRIKNDDTTILLIELTDGIT